MPVTYFVSEPFENWTKRDPNMTKVVRLQLHHSADVDSLRARFEQFVESNDKVIHKDSARVLVVDHDASGMVVGFYATAEEPLTAWTLECELREAMLKAVSELELERSDGRQYLLRPSARAGFSITPIAKTSHRLAQSLTAMRPDTIRTAPDRALLRYLCIQRADIAKQHHQGRQRDYFRAAATLVGSNSVIRYFATPAI